MERSRKILLKIASASRQVVTAANEYADRRDLNDVPRCHFRLEEDMQRIFVACQCLAGILDKTPEEGPAVDVRIQDWLNTGEPQECLHILSRMEGLLRQDTSSWIPRIFQRMQGSAPMQDKIKEAVDVFNSCKGCFHFLFSTEIWNDKRAVQKDVPQSRDRIVQSKSDLLKPKFPGPIHTEINTSMTSDPSVHCGHEEYVAQEESNIIGQGLPVPKTGTNITVRDQDGHAVTQKRHEMKTDKQREEQEEKLKEILKWLDGLNCAEKQDATLSLRQEDTCKWLFDTAQYKMWKNGETGSLWLRGKPGAGKSVLASFVIDSLRKATREGQILGFFYCDFRNERSTNSAEAMRSVLSQLLRQLRSVDLGDVCDDLMKMKEWGGGTLSNAKELAGFASRAARRSSQKPLVIVDALDECKDVRKLIQALMVIRGHVQLFVTSRPLRIIVDELSDLPFVSMDDMADKLSGDIELHVTRELDARPRLRDLDDEFKTDIRTVLSDKADGMFRWVQCSIDTLDRCVTRKEVRSALESLPKGLDETYERILLAIDMETLAGRLAQRALVWVVAAVRPLRLSEIMEGLSINLEARALDSEIGPMHSGALLDACGSLVTYTKKTGIIILSHSSVKEYLMGEFTRAKLQRYHISAEHAHLLLARSCMCYISICLKLAQEPALADVSGSSSTVVSSQASMRLHPKSQPLLDYALDDALDHFGYLGSTFKLALHDVTVLAEVIQRYSWAWDHVCIPARWRVIGSSKPHWPTSRHDLLLYVLVAFASNSFLSTFFRRTALKPMEGTNPLVYAAYFNKDEHAHSLLSRGARLNHRGWEISGFRQSLPIEVAFRERHYAMVTHFVQEGSTVPTHIFVDSFFQLPPSIPCIPAPIGKLLLQTDEFAENRDNCLSEGVWRAMKTSNQLLVFKDTPEQELVAVVRRFVQVADGYFPPNEIRQAFLRFAVAQGYSSAVQYLLTLGTHLPSDILVALHHYPGRWKTAHMIRFLVENGADVLAHTSHKGSVLHAALSAPSRAPYYYGVDDATEDDILEAIKLLVRGGCDPFQVDSHGSTPLHIAVERGYVLVAQYLLDIGASLPPDLLVTLNRDQSNWGTVAMIRLLVGNGANALARTSDGGSVLHLVLQSSFDDDVALEAVKVLIDYGCDPLEADPRGNTPLHFAVGQGHISVARHLLTLGVHLPPDLLVTLGHDKRVWMATSMIHFLVENRVDVLAHASDGDSALHIVLRSLYNDNSALEAVKALVDCGCDPLHANFRGDTPLHTAVERGHVSVARHLLTLGVPLPSDLLVTLDRDQLDWDTAYVIRFLVENGVNVLAHASSGDSLLHIALRSLYNDDEALEAVKLLVGYGCNLMEADSHGNTPFRIAVERGHVSVARYLLTTGAHSPDSLVPFNHHGLLWRTFKLRTLHFLVDCGFNIRVRASNGDSVLHIVLQSFGPDGDVLEAVKLLVDNGCDPFEPDNSEGHTPLQIAIVRGHISAAQYLLTLGAHLPPDLLVTLNSSTWWVTPSIIHFLVENRPDILAQTINGDSPFHIVLRSWSLYSEQTLEVVKILVDYGCDPLEANFRGDTPLHIAVECGHTSVAQYLLTLDAPLPPNLLVTMDHESVRWGTAPMIHFLYDNGIDFLAHTSNGDSLLHVVLRSWFLIDDDKALEVVQLLVSYGCDPLEANFRGETPLHIAVRRGYISVARCLVTFGAPLPSDLLVTLNRDQWCGNTISVIRFLVENGINTLARRSDGDSVLHFVLGWSYNEQDVLDTLKFLVSQGCDPLEANPRGKTPLHIAVEQGYILAAQYILTLGASLPPDLLVTLDRDRFRWSTTPMIRFLVEGGINVLAHDSDGDSVLHIALQCSNDDDIVETMKLLVSYGCDPLEANPRGYTPLHIAIEQGNISATRYLHALGSPLPPDVLVTMNLNRSYWCATPMIRFLVENGVNVLAHASNGDSALHMALRCFNGDHTVFRAIKLLVGHGCNPVEANSLGEVPLHLAAARSYVSVARYLISQGANVLTKASNGDTVLHFATGAIHFHFYNLVDGEDSRALESVKFFIGCGAEPAVPNNDGKTPLHHAVDLGHIKTVKYLLSLNVPLPRDILVVAIQSDNNYGYRRHIVETLVNSGCDTQTRNSEGDTPLQVAIKKGRIEVVEYLLSVVPVHDSSFEDLLSAAALAPQSAQSETRRVPSNLLARAETSGLASRSGGRHP